MHDRYEGSTISLTPASGLKMHDHQPGRQRVLPLGVQPCEMLVKFGDDGASDEVYPIDYANACPDVAITSLHYYFPGR